MDEDAEGQEEEYHAPMFESTTTYMPLHEESTTDASAPHPNPETWQFQRGYWLHQTIVILLLLNMTVPVGINRLWSVFDASVHPMPLAVGPASTMVAVLLLREAAGRSRDETVWQRWCARFAAASFIVMDLYGITNPSELFETYTGHDVPEDESFVRRVEPVAFGETIAWQAMGMMILAVLDTSIAMPPHLFAIVFVTDTLLCGRYIMQAESGLQRDYTTELLVGALAFTALFFWHLTRMYHETHGLMIALHASRRRAAQEAAERATKEVTGYVFHELRNDMNASCGVLEALIDDVDEGVATLPPGLLEMVVDGRVHAHHAVQVITNMLDFSQLREGKLQLRVAPFELRPLADEAAAMVRHLLRSKPGVVLSVLHLSQTRVLMLGPAFHLQQILLNLLSNACKHTTRGHVTLEIRELSGGKTPPDCASAAVHHVRRLHFSVSDSGSGVAPAHRSRIFEEWGGGPSGSVGDGLGAMRAGSGLGLCRRRGEGFER